MAKAEAAPADESEEKEGGGGGLVQMIISGVGIFVIVTASNIVTSMVMPPKVVAMAEPEAMAEEADPPPLYHALDPPLIANINSDQADFLQVSVELMARNELTIAAIDEHKAAIRNNLLLLFASAEVDDINTREAKEALRMQVLEEVQKVLEPYVESNVEEAYFTSFVAQ